MTLKNLNNKTMHYILIITLALSSYCAAQSKPSDYERLQKLRQLEINKINKQYLNDLEKLKSKYTKKGNLEVAVMIDKEIKNITSALKATTSIDTDIFTKWGDKSSYADLRKDGTAYYFWKGSRVAKGNWVRQGNEIKLTWDNARVATYYIDSFDGNSIKLKDHAGVISVVKKLK